MKGYWQPVISSILWLKLTGDDFPPKANVERSRMPAFQISNEAVSLRDVDVWRRARLVPFLDDGFMRWFVDVIYRYTFALVIYEHQHSSAFCFYVHLLRVHLSLQF